MWLENSDIVINFLNSFKKQELLSTSSAKNVLQTRSEHCNFLVYQKYINQTFQEDQS